MSRRNSPRKEGERMPSLLSEAVDEQAPPVRPVGWVEPSAPTPPRPAGRHRAARPDDGGPARDLLGRPTEDWAADEDDDPDIPSVTGPHADHDQEPEPTGDRTGFAEMHILWISEGMSCDGDTISVTAADRPAIEDLVLGLIPGLPKVSLHNKLLSATMGGEEFLAPFRAAVADELEPFILVVEGSVPNQNIIEGDGYWTSMGNDPDTGQPLTVNWWIDRLAPRAWAVVAIGTCAAYGGIHAMAGNPTGCMGLGDYLGWEFRSAGGLPIVNIPGCPVQPDNFMDVLTWLLYHAAGTAPAPPLDGMLRPQWLFNKSVHDGCDRAAYYEQGDLAEDYNAHKCQIKLGCWGTVVNCNVPTRGWMGGVGGCPNVGGVCIGCTMPGFPDSFMPFMDEPDEGDLSLSPALIKEYGDFIHRMRRITGMALNLEPEWRHNGTELTTGYEPHRPHTARDRAG